MLYLCSVKLKQQVIMESIRKHIYSWSEEGKVNLINELKSYIEQSEIGEQIGYMEELNEVKSNWWNLIHSGIYHDAIGKVVDAQFRGSLIIVNVAEEY
jgi:hypothetical protein